MSKQQSDALCHAQANWNRSSQLTDSQKAFDAPTNRLIVRLMTEQTTPKNGPQTATLIELPEAEQQQAMRQWRQAVSGMDGERAGMPVKPDDQVAYKLLDAAGDSIGRGDWQQGINILRLVVRDYRQSAEAACARQVLDRLGKRTQVR